jgi:hypothetical protein
VEGGAVKLQLGDLLVPFVVCQVHQGLVGDMVGTVDWCRGALGCQEGDE